jgi:recombinational DNA repair protein RecT
MENPNQKAQLMELIKSATPSKLIEDPLVADRFKELYNVIHGIRDQRVSQSFYTAEKFHFLKMISDSKNLQECTRLSMYGVFMDVAVSGLSFDPGMKHLYVVPYNVNVGTKDNPKWEKRASLQISGYGELLLRQLQGQIKYADNPVVVYEGDEFRYGSRNGQVILEHMATIPRTSETIIACYIRLVRHDDSSDYKVMALEDIQRLRKFSKDPNSKAWTDGLSGMVVAKTIKHAFKNYPKLRVGEFSQLASNTVDEEHTELPSLDYGLDAGSIPQELPEANGTYTPTMIITPAEDVVNDFLQEIPPAQPIATAAQPAVDELDF